MQIIGNGGIIDFLDKAVENNALAHSYIFSGPKNIGKKTAAYDLSSKLLNMQAEKLHQHPDFLEARAEAGVIKKEEIDRLVGRLMLSSFSGGYKILIINNAHLLNKSSANAFLKTLEEPPKRTLILLLTSQLGKILPTIISRSAVLNFKLSQKDEIKNFLEEKYNVEDPRMYANLCFGRPGLAVKLASANIKEENFQKISEFKKLFFGNYIERFKISSELTKGKDKKEQLLEKLDFWTEIARDAILFKYKMHDSIAHQGNIRDIEEISQKGGVNYFSSLILRFIKMRELFKNNINAQMMLENLII